MLCGLRRGRSSLSVVLAHRRARERRLWAIGGGAVPHVSYGSRWRGIVCRQPSYPLEEGPEMTRLMEQLVAKASALPELLAYTLAASMKSRSLRP